MNCGMHRHSITWKRKNLHKIRNVCGCDAADVFVLGGNGWGEDTMTAAGTLPLWQIRSVC